MPEIRVPDLEEATAELLSLLPDDFPVRNPDPFSAFGTYLRLAAQVGVDVRAFLKALLPQLYVVTATGEWLDEHARGLGLKRKEAAPARLRCRVLGDAPGTFPPGSPFGLGELRYRVEGAYSPGAEVEARSEGVGARYNLPPGTRLRPVTVVPGVEALEVVAVLEPGMDRETDEELRRRCIVQWPALSRGSTYHAYMAWALEDPEVRKVAVVDDHPRGQGTVDVVIAPAQGLPSPELVARVQAKVEERRPLTVSVLVRPPTPIPLSVRVRVHPLPGGSRDPSVWADRIRLFLQGLNIGEAFWPSRLMDVLHDTGEAEGVEVLAPGPVRPPRGGLVVPADVEVTL